MNVCLDSPFEIKVPSVHRSIMQTVHGVLAPFQTLIPSVKIVVHKVGRIDDQTQFECVFQLETHKSDYWLKFYGAGRSCEQAIETALADVSHYLNYKM